MGTTTKLAAGVDFPVLTLPRVGGGEVRVGDAGKWQVMVVYRGKHCPICRRYLKGLDGLLDEFKAADIDVVVVSGDSKEKAESEAAEEGWHFPVGYGLSFDQMRRLGLYISHPRTPPETDTDFSEPGLFVVNPDGQAHIIDISNAPFARPDLAGILAGVKMVRERNFPVRGTAD